MNTAALQESLARAEANFQADDTLDVNLLDQVMEIMNGCQGELQQKANVLLVALQHAPDTWRKVDMILEYSKSMETRYFGLQILENTIKTRWRALPAEQREGVKSFVASMIMKLCKQDDQPSALLLQKVNVVLVQIVKQDWPRNWPTFMPDLIRSAETDPRVCVNSMKVLGLLSEDVFDFGCQSLTQAKENYLKENFCGQFQDVFNFCLRLMKECPADDIVKANLKTIRRFMTWIPVTFIYDTDVLPLLTDRFLPLDAYRLPALQCLTEVSSITNLTEAYKAKLRATFFSAIKVLAEFIGPSFDMAEAYARGTEEDQRFVTSLSDFLVAFLKNNAELVEVFKENGSMEMELHNYAIQLLLSLSTVDDVEIFKVCLEFWLQLTQDLYRVDPFTKPHHMHFPGVNLPVHLRDHPRKELYRNHLSHLRTIIIGRMAKPEEVLVVENEQGEVVRELVKDTDAITLYKTMRETLVFLTHLDSKDTEAKMTEKLAAQVSGGEFSWKALNTLCWAVGSISMTMPEEDEKRFLVLVIRDLLGLCEQKRGKDNKAVIASNIMYIVGQYPRFLRAHWKFLKTVVNKLFEFMHESHEGVQDMACDTFIKIAIKCKRHFTIIQMGESEPFVDEMLTNLNGNICDLSSPQVHVFYEAMGHIISSKSEPEEQKNLISRLMQPPNSNWDEIILSASSDVGCLGDVDMLKSVANILKTNTAACKSIGGSFYSQLSRNFNDMLCLYRILSEQVSEAIKNQGEEILKNPVVKQIRAVKKEILILISTWSSKAEVATELRETVVPQLFDAVLFDYQKNVPQAREPKVLSLLAIIVAQLQEHTYPFVTHILESVFGCTLEMINKDFESFPEHRVNFFHLLMSLIQECFPVIIKLSKSELDYIVSAIVWAFQHSLRAVAELGLDIVREILERAPHMVSSEDRAAAQLFYQNHFMVILEHLLAIAADSSQVHVAGLTYYADVLCCLFRAAEHQITVPLNPNNPSQSNLDYVSECITTLFHNHYSNNLNSDQIRVFVKGFFSYNGEVASMRNHLRDFLIQIKECKGEDTADLFLEEKEAQIMAIQEQKYKVPGLMNPNEIVDDEDMEFNRSTIDLETRGRRIRLAPRKNDAPEEQFAQVF